MLDKLRNNSKNNKTKNVVVRVTDEELKVLAEKAEKHTRGNISDFIRHAFLKWTPKHDRDQSERN